MNDNTTIPPIAPTGRWCILRTAGPRTLPLARSLAEAGFDVWTPRGWTQPAKRASARPANRRTAAALAGEPVAVPIMPTFIFARADRLADLVRASRDAASEHGAFSIFRYQGRYPLVSEADLSDLRAAEQKADIARRRKRTRRLVMGQRVTFDRGAFAGIEGVVEDQAGKFAIVAFAGGFRMKIAAWREEFDDVEDGTAHVGAAA